MTKKYKKTLAVNESILRNSSVVDVTFAEINVKHKLCVYFTVAILKHLFVYKKRTTDFRNQTNISICKENIYFK